MGVTSECGVVLRVLGVASECRVVMLPLRVLGVASELGSMGVVSE